VGDQVLAIDDSKYEPIQSFVDKADKRLRYRFNRPDQKNLKKDNRNSKEVKSEYGVLDAMRTSIEIIKRDGRKIGYVHIWSYAGEQYQQLLEEEIAFGKLKEADSLILDLRDGGADSPNYLNILQKKFR